MTQTTHSEFNRQTEALEVAKAFSEGIRGKTILVTGANTDGLGYATCEAFASQAPAHIIVASRTPAKIQACIDKLKAEYPNVDYRPLVVDLSSQKSVRKAAAEVLSWEDVPTIDIVMNSAGVMAIPERTLSEDGIEMHFATNHIGHFLLTCLLMPKLIKASEKNPKGATRIINVSSGSPQSANMRWSDMNFEKKNKDLPEDEQPNYELLERWGYKDLPEQKYVGLEGYNISKISNVLFGIEVNRRLYDKYGIFSIAVHPGVIFTELGRNFPPEVMSAMEKMLRSGQYPIKTLGQGAATGLVAALDPKLGPGGPKNGLENSGVLMQNCQITDDIRPASASNGAAARLWKLSEELVHEKFDW
ncbi:putative short-chain dehydrogenase [Xylaria sp. CBS 124048]|nr:putative short-chain dehydrogenase [Xylaria sp. CBS 124048]